MSKAVLISIKPEWCELIANGNKTIEVRKTKPKLETPFKVYIYSTKPKNKNDLGLCLDKGMFGTLKKVGLLYKRNYETAKHLNMQILSGKVIGEFVCDKITELAPINRSPDDVEERACLTRREIVRYLKGRGYAWLISDLVIYDKPKELSEFARHDNTYDNAFGGAFEDRAKNTPIKRPPQSWCYVEEAK